MNHDTSRLTKLDHQYLWHPFTQMQGWIEEEPVIIARGEGDMLYDTAGREYLDGISSLWVTVHGHNHPVINQAIKDQVDRVSHSTLLGLGNVPAIELAGLLAQITPSSVSKVFYSDAGATAVEIALKMAFQYWQQTGNPERVTFARLKEAYHGDTLGAVSVGGMELFHGAYKPLIFDTVALPCPYCYRCELGLEPETCDLACAEEGARIIASQAHRLAALIIEPLVQGAGGIITHPEGYLARLARACREHDVLLIADEVAVGFGRTGKMFAVEWEDVQPDILCLGKGLSGGYLPIAATVASQRVFDGFLGRHEEFKTLFHGHTFTGNPVAAAASIASLGLFSSERTLERMQPKIEQLKKGLERFKELKIVGQVRQRGMMVGIEMVQDKKTRASFPSQVRMGHRVTLAARERGVIIRPLSDVMVLMPSPSLRPENLDRLLDVTFESIKAQRG